MADYGDEIHEYIQQLASASAANNATDTAANVQTTNKLTTMEAEIKKLTATIASMATKLNNGENINPNGGDNKQTRHPQMKKLQNMGVTAACMVFTQWETSTTVQPASTRSLSTRATPHGATGLGATCIGPTPSASQWNNRITHRGKEMRLPPTDINRGLQA